MRASRGLRPPWASALVLVASLVLSLLLAGPARGTVKADLHYGPDPQQVLDVHLPPEGSGRRPAVILIHGGGWVGGDQRTQATVAEQLASRGWVVVATTYRKRAPCLPNAYLDVKRVLRWVRGHAAALRIDRTRIAAWGDSAGGHLALLLGTQGRVMAVVAWSPPTDLSTFTYSPPVFGFPPDVWSGYMTGVVGCGKATCPGVYAEMSPINHLRRGSAPVYLSYYGTDLVHHLEQGAPFLARARRAGVKVAWRITPAIGHGVDPDRLDDATGWLAKRFADRYRADGPVAPSRRA